MSKIIKKLSDVISEEEWNLLYNEVRYKVLNDLFREKYSNILNNNNNNKEIQILKDNK